MRKTIFERVLDPNSASNVHIPFQKDIWEVVANITGKQTKGARIIGFGEGGATLLNLQNVILVVVHRVDLMAAVELGGGDFVSGGIGHVAIKRNFGGC